MARYQLREGDIEGFFRAPFEAYPESWPYASPLAGDLRRLLDRDANPFFDRRGDGTHFTVYRAGVPVGRVSAHVDREANRRFSLQRGSFGFLDVADDPEALRLLLRAAERWAHDRGCTELAGNFSLTASQEIGVVTDGHGRPPYTAMHWSPPHLAGMLEDEGYEAFFPMSTYELELADFDPASLLGPKQRALLGSDALAWSRLGRWAFRRRREDVRRILNESFADNPLFVPLSRSEFDFQAGPLSWVVDGRLSLLVHDGEAPAGVLVCIPDLNPLLRRIGSRLGWSTPFHYLRHRRRARRAVVVFAGVTPPFQNRGMLGAMLHRVTRSLKSAGYTHLGITWVSRENTPSLRNVEKLGARRLHDLSLYRTSLEARR